MQPDKRKLALNVNSKMWDLEQVSETLLFLPLSFPTCKLWVGNDLPIADGICAPLRLPSNDPNCSCYLENTSLLMIVPLSRRLTTPNHYSESGSGWQAMTSVCAEDWPLASRRCNSGKDLCSWDFFSPHR